MNIKDKPAFPTFLDDGCSWTQGITIRDYFAAKAMQGMISNNWPIVGDDASIASITAYEMADAMLEARNK